MFVLDAACWLRMKPTPRAGAFSEDRNKLEDRTKHYGNKHSQLVLDIEKTIQ